MIKCLEDNIKIKREINQNSKFKSKVAYEKDLKERTQKYAVEIIKLTFELKKNKTDFALVDQLLRSGTSIGANVREAKASSTKK